MSSLTDKAIVGGVLIAAGVAAYALNKSMNALRAALDSTQYTLSPNPAAWSKAIAESTMPATDAQLEVARAFRAAQAYAAETNTTPPLTFKVPARDDAYALQNPALYLVYPDGKNISPEEFAIMQAEYGYGGATF